MRRMGWSPSVRLFEAAACGTPIISDNWRGLSDLFPAGEACMIAGGPHDVLRALALPEPRRRAVGLAGRARVLAGHTGRARARELARALRQQAQAVAATGT
jgi:spore maturation protein CgeB